MLFSQLLPLVLVTLVVAEQAKITFYSGFEYQGKEAELPTTDPASQDECVDIHFLLNGPAKSARITDSHCFLFRTTGCQGGASYLLTKDSPVFRPRGGGLPVEAYSVRCNFSTDYEGKEFEIPTTDSTYYYACVNIYSLLGESTAKSAVITKGSNCLIYENEECQGRKAYELKKNTSKFLVPGRSGPVLGKSVKCIFPAGESSLDKEQGYAPEL
ncbi:hypothetical protein O988_09366 [Pseudogymnoascus sp. VKM F-3808]|nr:hypothetical protein O988_09366 [Pseudogymnoascus sp. VKM F-3808]